MTHTLQVLHPLQWHQASKDERAPRPKPSPWLATPTATVAQQQDRNQQKEICCGLCTMKQAQAQGIIGSLWNLNVRSGPVPERKKMIGKTRQKSFWNS